LLLAGCTATSHAARPAPQTARRSVLIDTARADVPELAPQASDPNEAPAPYTVLHETTDKPLGMYEPSVGCYLGALLDDNAGGAGIRAFEERVGAKHAVFAAEMYTQDDFATMESWMLYCIAAQGTPLIYLHQGASTPARPPLSPAPMGSAGFFPVSLLDLKRAAEWLGAYNIPVFVAFEPYNTTKNDADYIRQFKLARTIFMEYAPKAAFVWLVDADARQTHYPGHDAADWVGIRVLASLQGEAHSPDILDAVDAFYHRFHTDKPILLTGGVSHFSHTDYTYRIPQAAQSLKRLCAGIRYRYPRIKMLIYTDTDIKKDDYSITKDNALIQVYQNSVSNNHFLASLANETNHTKMPMWQRSEWAGYYINGTVYLNAKTAGLPALKQADTFWVDSVAHTKAEKLEQHFTVVDHEQRVIYVYSKINP
jgi:hypothetical protein